MNNKLLNIKDNAIFCRVCPGVFLQNVYINQNGTMEQLQMGLQDIPEFILSKNNITDIYLAGFSGYMKKIEADVENLKREKYDKNKTFTFHYI